MEILGQTGIRERRLRGIPILMIAGSLALIAILFHTTVAFWADNEFTQPEGIVATQAFSLAQDGTLYYDLKQYPYTVCAYMPLFYGMVAALNRAGVPVLIGGRVLSLLALGAVFWLIWKILILYTRDRLCAATGLCLSGVTQLLLGWGIVGQVDMLAIAIALAAFYQYSLHNVLGKATLDRAAVLSIAALFTKQTAIAAPLAIFVLLLHANPKSAWRFGAIVGGVGGAMVLGVNAWMQGRFIENTVLANLNPFAFYKVKIHFEYMAVALLPLIPIVLIGAPKALRTSMRSAFVYLGIAAAVLLLTAAKVGSDSNYQIETAILLILCSCLALHAMNFFTLTAGRSQSWITLLVLPLALYGVQNLRVATSGLAQRIGREQMFRTQVQGLAPYLSGSGQVLSTDSNALVQFKRRFEVEPLIYRLLVEAGRVDGNRVLGDIDRGKFQTVLLYENLSEKPDIDPEFPRLTDLQSEAIRKRYRMVKHLPGPYLSGLYVYRPMAGWPQ